MKNTMCILAAVAAISATSAFGGSPADPVVEKPIIVADTAGTSSGAQAQVALLALLMLIGTAD